MAESVGDFMGRLGLDVDDAAWEHGFNRLQQMRQHLRALQIGEEEAKLAGHDVALATKAIGLEMPKAQKYTEDWSEALEGLAGYAKKAAVAVGAVVAGLGYMIVSSLDGLGKVDDMRQKTGLAAEAFQEYGYAARIAGGITTEQFAQNVEMLSKKMKGTEDGKKAAVAAFTDLGISMEEVKGAMAGGDGLDQLLLDLAKKFAAMPDGPEKTAKAMAVFGKGGAAMIPMLNMGASKLGALREEAKRLGLVLSGDALEGAADAADGIQKIKEVAHGLVGELATNLAPHIKKASDTILLWVQANRELIADKVKEFAEGIVAAVGKFIEVVTWVYDNREMFLGPIRALGEIIESTAHLVEFLAKAFARIKEVVGPVFEWIEDKLGKIGAAIQFVIDKLPGGGGAAGGGTPWYRKVAGAAWDLTAGPVADIAQGKMPGLGAVRAVQRFGDQDATSAAAQYAGGDNGASMAAFLGGLGGGSGTPTIPGGTTNNTDARQYEVTTQIAIHAAPGLSAEDVASAASKAFDDSWNQKLRQAKGN